MRFSSAQTLALSLLAGQLALAIPLDLAPTAPQSLQPHNQETVDFIRNFDDTNRRRSSDTLAALTELFSRATGTNPKPKKTSQENDSGSSGQAPQGEGLNTGPKPGESDSSSDTKQKPAGTDSSSDVNPKPVKIPAADSPEWAANKQLAIEKGKTLRQQLQEELTKRGQNTGDETPVVTDTSDFYALKGSWGDDFIEWDETSYLFRKIDPTYRYDEDWPTRSTYYHDAEVEFPALKIAASKEARALSVQVSYKQDAGPDPPAWTKMLFESAKELLGAEGLKDLKWINRHNVQATTTKDTQGVLLETTDAIQYAYRKLGAKFGKELTIDFNPADPLKAEVVEYLSAQTHIARILQLLKDYPASFNYKQISKLHLRDRSMPAGILIQLTDTLPPWDGDWSDTE